MAEDRFEDITGLARMDLTRRRVFLRTDLNTPLSPYGAVLDDTQLRLALPTIRALLALDCKVILASHFGTPASKPEPHHLGIIAARLTELLGVPVELCGSNFRPKLTQMKDRDVILFPNLLDLPEDLEDDPAFARSIARSVDVYVNDSLRISDQRTAH